MRYLFILGPMVVFLFSCGGVNVENKLENYTVKNSETITIKSGNGFYDEIVLKFSENGSLDSLNFMSSDKPVKNSIKFQQGGGIQTITQYHNYLGNVRTNNVYTFDNSLNLVEEGSAFGIVNYEDSDKQAKLIYANVFGKDILHVDMIDTITPDYKRFKIGSSSIFDRSRAVFIEQFPKKRYSGIMLTAYLDSSKKDGIGTYINLK